MIKSLVDSLIQVTFLLVENMMIRILLPVALTSLILSPLVSLDPLGNFTFSKCKVQQPLDTFGNVSGIEDCQKRCQSNYRCGFFTLNMALHVCDLFTGSGDTFTRDCLEVGGPKNIDFTDWMLDSNPCKVRSMKWILELLRKINI